MTPHAPSSARLGLPWRLWSIVPAYLRGAAIPGRILVVAMLLGSFGSAQSPSHVLPAIRFGFMARVIGHVNRADVKAAVKAWLQIVSRERGLAVDPDPQIYDALGDLDAALHQQRIDLISVTMDEFLLLEKSNSLNGLFANRVDHKLLEQYVLLVNRDQDMKDLRDPRGREIMVLDHPRTTLVPLWLDTALLRQKLPPATRFFGKLRTVLKPELAILPVFFRQAGAALVTRSSFNLACELNPQLGKMLTVLVASPDLLPTVASFRGSITPEAMDQYRKVVLTLPETPVGRSILNLFQTGGIVEIDASLLAGTRALLAEHARLKAAAERRGGP